MPPDRRFPFQGPRPCNSNGTPAPQHETTHSQQVQAASKPAAPPAHNTCPSSADSNPLRILLQKTDADTLLILAVLLLLAKERKDPRLLLALAYIML